MNISLKMTAALSLVLLLTAAEKPSIRDYTGTWTGTSKCISERPSACKDEVVVYRFVPIDGKPMQLVCYGDKIVEGKRLPMGALIFDYNADTHSIRSELKAKNATGLWSFSIAGETMVGMLVVQPHMNMVRDVKVHRVKKDSEVPPAPALKEYEE